MADHFEDLWLKAEDFHKDGSKSTAQQIVEEIILKVNLYKAIAVVESGKEQEATKAKSHLFGEILFSLTNLSFVDNVNTFEALGLALQQRLVECLGKKYPV
jgi:hypothetical protein